MLEPRWVRWLASLLPEDARTDLFEPSYHDLRFAHVSAATGSLWLATRVLVLFFECWLLWGREIPVRRNQSAPPKERFAMFLYLVRHALRLLVREPAFALAAIVTLALGVGANVAVLRGGGSGPAAPVSIS
ncbi:MAG TPA: hypothetical protein VKU19_41540 [Bryobacteraceae bacterium]|nr:hypothetical protein [Bryobacteraceae bacterium]